MILTKLLAEHFYHPQHYGVFAQDTPDIVTACIDSKTTGRMLILQLRVQKCIIKETRFKAHGCPYTIATASYLAQKCLGCSLEEAKKITRDQLSKELELPAARYHCAVIAEDALKTAINEYINRS